MCFQVSTNYHIVSKSLVRQVVLSLFTDDHTLRISRLCDCHLRCLTPRAWLCRGATGPWSPVFYWGQHCFQCNCRHSSVPGKHQPNKLTKLQAFSSILKASHSVELTQIVPFSTLGTVEKANPSFTSQLCSCRQPCSPTQILFKYILPKQSSKMLPDFLIPMSFSGVLTSLLRLTCHSYVQHSICKPRLPSLLSKSGVLHVTSSSSPFLVLVTLSLPHLLIRMDPSA